eukprot:CAMPEP_0175126196 /NCGR_PEP_ID=MMETSP0087-20121206/3718_1 /TAXON_ID=136419 /ORGANISM="Unknown Unknown, Strain D1" /LENGTH=222 /DNA_ID=CAMNT_0016408079 /DNA_START=26 /DNA_END=691 /DNA_ORIENTATION=+
MKETPSDAFLVSHKLLHRAGFIRQLGVGFYILMPLGLRVLRKIEKIIDEELQAIGCQRTQMPMIMSAQLWKKTGRWDEGGDELFRLKDRKGGDFCIGPTHEEAFTSHVASLVSSPKSLPLRLYQVGSKFRDERRPRFGLLRAREFVMKDLYSFDATTADALTTYSEVSCAYDNIFSRLGVPFVKVDADSGAIGGKLSQEYHFTASAGEDCLLVCDSSSSSSS